MKFTRIATGPEGHTHFHDEDLPLEPAGTIGRLSALQPAAGLVLRETDAAYDYDWHPAPRRQWVVLLDGEIEIETGDGARRRFRGGDILMLEDTHGRGHRTRQLSAGLRHSLFIPTE